MERRSEKRLRYQWPVWFAEDFNGILSQGQMVDISSGGAAFTCVANKKSPRKGQLITARFSVPYYGSDENFDVNSFIRTGAVCRIDKLSNGLNRVAVQFLEILPFKPGEQSRTDWEYDSYYEPALV